MNSKLGLVLLVMAATGSGLVGGIFFAFSNFVMTALARRPAEEGAAAMRSINETVLNPLFFTVFFGTGVLALTAGVLALSALGSIAGWATLTAALFYLAGSIGVTMAFNVPLNERLRKTPSGNAQLASVWAHYYKAWTRWNTLRTIASVIAALLFAAAVAA